MNEMVRPPYVGSAQRRVDGALKVTGGATYAAEFTSTDLAHGYVVSSAIAKGRIVSIDTSAALAVPGVIDVMTHENRPAAPFARDSFQDAVAPPGVPFRPLESARIVYSGQPVALVLAENLRGCAPCRIARRNHSRVRGAADGPSRGKRRRLRSAGEARRDRAAAEAVGECRHGARRCAVPYRAGLSDRD